MTDGNGWRPHVLLVDDDVDVCADLKASLSGRFETESANTGQEALARASAYQPDVVLLDVALQARTDGFEVLETLRASEDPPAVVMITGSRDVGTIVRAMRGGAWDYVCKPIEAAELTAVLERCLLETGHRRHIRAQKEDLDRTWGGFQAADPRSLQLLRDIDRVAPMKATVMITGACGTGKEMVARRLWERSGDPGPFVPVNCGAIPAELIESEMFGHERGAFTGAVQRRAGKFEVANGGTLFLDEIGHSPVPLQIKLLRVIETKRFSSLGSESEKEREANCRIIAATSRDLERAVAAGEFLPELYYRLNVVRLHVLPLRERPGDIVPLARWFLRQAALDVRRSIVGLTPEAEQALREQAWPGNVRELRNTIERAALNCRTDRIEREDLFVDSAPLLAAFPDYHAAKEAAVRDFKLRYLTTQLRHAEGNTRVAAERSGMLRQAFELMCKKEGLDPARFRPERAKKHENGPERV